MGINHGERSGNDLTLLVELLGVQQYNADIKRRAHGEPFSSSGRRSFVRRNASERRHSCIR